MNWLQLALGLFAGFASYRNFRIATIRRGFDTKDPQAELATLVGVLYAFLAAFRSF